MRQEEEPRLVSKILQAIHEESRGIGSIKVKFKSK
jgi:hypothetical protein